MTQNAPTTLFGKRNEPHTVIIAKGDRIRHFTLRPWAGIGCFAVMIVMAASLLGTTGYLFIRDDLATASLARQARLQQAYEDRISALRAQVDRITSRQLLDQQVMEDKVGELLQRQTQLQALQERMGMLPAGATDKDAHALPGMDARGAAYDDAALNSTTSNEPAATTSRADQADRLFGSLTRSLRGVEDDQMARIDDMTSRAYRSADTISTALRSAGLPVEDVSSDDQEAMGGPLVPIDKSQLFAAKARELDGALDALDSMKTAVRKLPLANPSPGRAISSPFGVRSDPLLGTPALHTGLDFRAPAGSDARATGAGIVTRSGGAGGYGQMVEIDHGNGIATRYAHLSRILVAEGQRVAAGDVVGEVGSTGRSTGPHLHYEVRRSGEPTNPMTYIRLGSSIASYL